MERHEIALDHRDGDLILDALRSLGETLSGFPEGTRAGGLATYILACFDADHRAAASSGEGGPSVEIGGVVRYGDRMFVVTENDGQPQLSTLMWNGQEVRDYEDEGAGLLSLDLASGDVVVVTREELRQGGVPS